MKNLDLKSYGIETMSNSEMKEANGGWITQAITLLSVGIYLYNNYDDFAAGFEKGYENARQ